MTASDKTAAAAADASEEAVEVPFTEVDALQDQGVSVADITKLKGAGIATVESVISVTRTNLAKIKGFSEAKVEKIKEAASKIVIVGFQTGSEISREREKVISITSGAKALDAILGGGFMTSSVSEVYGEFRCGKTQMCHTLAVACQLPVEDGGAGGKCAYIDTEGTFRPQRIASIARRFGVEEDHVLNNIVVGRALNSEHQDELLMQLAAKMAEEGCYKLLIVDSIISLFRVDYTGRGELAARQAALNQHLSKLTRIAEDFNVAVVLVNQVSADPGAMAFQADKNLGGHVLAHASSTRVALRKGRGEERIAKIVDSPEMPEAEATYRITNGGIDDVAS